MFKPSRLSLAVAISFAPGMSWAAGDDQPDCRFTTNTSENTGSLVLFSFSQISAWMVAPGAISSGLR